VKVRWWELTSSGVQAAIATITFEVLCFLVRDQNLEVVEVALAVVAPWTLQLFAEVGKAAFLVLRRHCGGDRDK